MMESDDPIKNFPSTHMRDYSTNLSGDEMFSFGFDKERFEGVLRPKVFSDANFSSDGAAQEATELTSLRPRGTAQTVHSYSSSHSKLSHDNVVYLERDILPTDTLQSFALMYGCTLNDLKRANNLISEQAFFALRQIKIPVKKHGLLTELEEEMKRRPTMTTSLPGEPVDADRSERADKNSRKESDGSFTDAYLDNSQDDGSESGERRNLVAPLLHRDSAIEHNDAGKFLKTVDKEIRSTVKKSESKIHEKNEVLEEVVSSLGSVGFHPVPLPGSKSPSDCDGATWGLTWQTVLISFIVGLFLIIVYIVITNVFGL